MPGKQPDALVQETALALLVLIPSLGRIADDAARAEGTISPVQARYLDVLLGGPIRGVELAARLRATRAAVAEVVRRLETAKLVRTVPNPSDGRARLIEVTPAGAAAIERFGEVTSAAVARAVRRLPQRSLRALRDAAAALAPLLTDSLEEMKP